MEFLHFMVPIAILLVVIAIAVFFWAVRNGQFDDLERQGYNILLDEDEEQPNKQRKRSQTGPKQANDTEQRGQAEHHTAASQSNSPKDKT